MHRSRKALLVAFDKGNHIYEMVVHSKKGDMLYKVTYILVRNTNTGHVRALVVARDYSELKNKEESFIIEKERYEKEAQGFLDEQLEIVQALSCDYMNVYLVEPFENRGRIIKLNGYVTRGIQSRDKYFEYYKFCLRYIEDRVYPDDKEMLKEKMKPESIIEALGTRREYTISYRVLDNNEVHYYQAKYICLETNRHIVAGFQNIDSAVMFEKQQKDKLEKALAAAKEANKAKSTFLFNMSHDIRTPMNAIIGFTELLSSHRDDPEKVSDYISKIRSSSEYLLSLINNVLEMARIESGKSVLDETIIDAREFNDSIFYVFENQMAEKNINFTRSLNVHHNKIYCDTVKVKEVLLNILGNAYKYTLPGGTVDFRVDELPAAKEGYVLYRTQIEDTGIGMSKDFLDHIFEDFSRERTSTDSGQRGTGLGMAIAKQLVDIMNGKIYVESKQGKGSRFTVIIPHRIVDEKIQPEKCNTNSQMVCDSFKGKRLLIAEDNDLNAEIAMTILSEAGFEVDRARDGIECLGKLEKVAPGYYDLILMDIQMPNMNGYKATKIIRSLDDDRLSKIPIIAMTANAFAEDKKKALEIGMDAHIAKPVSVEVLKRALAQILI